MLVKAPTDPIEHQNEKRDFSRTYFALFRNRKAFVFSFIRLTRFTRMAMLGLLPLPCLGSALELPATQSRPFLALISRFFVIVKPLDSASFALLA